MSYIVAALTGVAIGLVITYAFVGVTLAIMSLGRKVKNLTS